MARVAIVTGGAGGLGSAIVVRLRGDGMTVVVADLPAVDVTDPRSVERLVSKVLGEHGSLDVLVTARVSPARRHPLSTTRPTSGGASSRST